MLVYLVSTVRFKMGCTYLEEEENTSYIHFLVRKSLLIGFMLETV